MISGTGSVTQNGSGNLILSNTSTYTGATTVNAGTLSVNGDISSSSGVTVNNGGMLGGTGTVAVHRDQFRRRAGARQFHRHHHGQRSSDFNAGSNYNVEVSPTTADRTNVIGSATLAGTVNAAIAAGTYIAKQYTILNATGGVTGTFGTLANTSLPSNVSAALSYDANNVYLDLTLNYCAARRQPERQPAERLQRAHQLLQQHRRHPDRLRLAIVERLEPGRGRAGRRRAADGFYRCRPVHEQRVRQCVRQCERRARIPGRAAARPPMRRRASCRARRVTLMPP